MPKSDNITQIILYDSSHTSASCQIIKKCVKYITLNPPKKKIITNEELNPPKKKFITNEELNPPKKKFITNEELNPPKKKFITNEGLNIITILKKKKKK